MACIARDITWLIGKTPLLEVSRFAAGARLLAKLEGMSPTNRNKDRAVLAILAVRELARREPNLGKLIAAMLPDHGEHYADHEAFAEPRGAR